MRPLAVLIAALALMGAGCVSVEVINKETPLVQEQAAQSPATSTDAIVPPTESTSTEPVVENATTTSPEPQPSVDVRFLDKELRLQATVGTDGVTLTWTPIAEGKTDGYKIVRSSSDPLPWYPKSGAIAFVKSETGGPYLDRGAKSGESHWYRICAVMTDAPVACGNVVKIELP
jgi:hypothetical protein